MKTKHGRTAATLTVMLAAATLLLTACAPTDAVAPGGATAATSESTQQQQAFPEFYAQEIQWRPCGPDEAAADQMLDALRDIGARVDGMRCGAIEVPQDWTDPTNGETMLLNIVHIPSTGDAQPIGTLLSNPGGPGASGVTFTIGMAATPAYAPLQEQYDLLGFDPRGIAGSSPLQCETDTSIRELQLAECAEQEPLAASMGSAQVARDMDLMRHLMGDELLHYAGFSYGTVIGASYVTLFPERVGRVMLDSAWPSDWSSPLGVYQQLEARAAASIDMLEQCGTTYAVATCPADGEAALTARMVELETTPLIASDGTMVGASTWYGYLTTGLYQLKAGREAVLDIAGRAVNGDQSAIDALATAMAGGGAAVDLSGMVVRCLSAPRDPGIIGVYRYIQERGLPTLLGGPEVDDTTLKPFLDLSCDALPDSGEDYLEFSNRGEQPVLVFGITGDHATPYEGARQLVKELGNATLVTLEGRGHIASFGGRSTCADDIASAYLLRGEMPATGTVCTDD